MKYKLQTLNKGEIDAGYVNGSMQNVRVGDLEVPVIQLCKFFGRLVRHPNYPFFIGNGIISGMLEYPEMLGPKKVILGDYEINGGDFGALAERLINEGATREFGEI